MSHPGEAAPQTVTVVDDEPCTLDVLVRAARSWRYECQAATSAALENDLSMRSRKVSKDLVNIQQLCTSSWLPLRFRRLRTLPIA